MRLVIAAIAAWLPLSSTTAAPQPVQAPAPEGLAAVGAPNCDSYQVRHAQSPDKPSAKTLDQLPAGTLRLAVHREVDGCIEPVIVRQNIGGNKAADEPQPQLQMQAREPRLGPL